MQTALVADLHLGTGLTTVRSQAELAEAGELPPWIGDADVQRSHRAALLRKDPEHYRAFIPDVPDDLPYTWPLSDRPPSLERRSTGGGGGLHPAAGPAPA